MGLLGGNARGTVNIQGMFPQAAIESLLVLLEEGALVSIGLTKDRGALSFSVWVDGTKDRDWYTDPELFTEALSLAAGALSEREVPPSINDRRRGRQKGS